MACGPKKMAKGGLVKPKGLPMPMTKGKKMPAKMPMPMMPFGKKK